MYSLVFLIEYIILTICATFCFQTHPSKEILLVREFMNLAPEIRSALYAMFEKAFSADATIDESLIGQASENEEYIDYYAECPKTAEELEALYPPIDIGEVNKLKKEKLVNAFSLA